MHLGELPTDDVVLHGLEGKGDEFQQKLRLGFLQLAREFPEDIVIIDAGGSADEVQQRLRTEVEKLLA